MCIRCCSFSIGADEIAVENFIKRYHFGQNDKELVQSAAVFLAGIVQVDAAIGYEDNGVTCAVTLGKHYDELAGIAEDSGNLLLSYCIECLGMEFLASAYEKISETVFTATRKWLGDYRFLDVVDIEKDQSLFPICEAGGIQFEKGMLHPLKSVVFTAGYKEEKSGAGHDCGNCENAGCDYRQAAIIE